ncbi:MAG: hypothetical protein O3A51_12490, partial [Verrucomicrobia bacterium]|nr:hypothetical protein [Verrucomicrobiota bacterium]
RAPLIHVMTVHWCTDQWIDIQQRNLQQHLHGPYRTYGFLTDIAPSQRARFDFSLLEPLDSHPTKLNILADIAMHQAASDDDILLFLDGDAFPIAPLDAVIRQQLARDPLMAIQRLENDGDVHPHPSFCATTVRFWKSIPNGWQRGYRWQTRGGRTVSDVGGNILERLETDKLNWYPLLRSNRVNLHPVWFGIYDNLIYHHGAGFRPGVCRTDLREFYADKPARRLWGRTVNRLLNPGVVAAWRDRLHPYKRLRRRIARQNEPLHRRVLHDMQTDHHFFRQFM